MSLKYLVVSQRCAQAANDDGLSKRQRNQPKRAPSGKAGTI